MKKRNFLFVCILVLLTVVIIKNLGVFSKESEEIVKGVIEDAILYTINEDERLEYNVVYEKRVSQDVVVAGCGIDNLKELKKIMGDVDSPAAQLGTHVGKRTLGKAVTADLTYSEKDEIIVVNVKKVTERPVIGISWKKNTIGDDYKNFAESFERNGGYAVYLPQVTDAIGARRILEGVSGIFMTGGEDWNPQYYGENPVQYGSVKWNDIRDTSDYHMLKQAIAMDVPLLAVCRGVQGLNISLGGGLIQDIPLYLGKRVINGEIDMDRVSNVLSGSLKESEDYRVEIDGIAHRNGKKFHGISLIDDESKWLYSVIKSNNVDFVSTAHHQAIDPKRIGKGLTVVASSSDGIIEAVEYQDNLFALGLQWHPERDSLGDSGDIDVNQDAANAPLAALVYYASVYNMDGQ